MPKQWNKEKFFSKIRADKSLSNFQRFASNCAPDIKVIRLNDDQKQLIVDLHNFYRIQVASGNAYSYITVANHCHYSNVAHEPLNVSGC